MSTINPEPIDAEKVYFNLNGLLDDYKDRQEGYIYKGACIGIDCWFLVAEFTNGYITVARDEETNYKVIGIQGNVQVRIGPFFTFKSCLIGSPDDLDFRDELDIFDKANDRGGFREIRPQDSFGMTEADYTLLGKAEDNQGLYYFFDENNQLVRQERNISAFGVINFNWLKKMGMSCDLQVVIGAQLNTFENATNILSGFKITMFDYPSVKGIVSIGIVGEYIDSFLISVEGEIHAGCVTFTKASLGVSGMAKSTPNTISAELGVAFGSKVKLGPKIAKLLDTKEEFFVIEGAVSGDFKTDFSDLCFTLEATWMGFIEGKGYYKSVNGEYRQAGLSVGTVKTSQLQVRAKADVTWNDTMLSIKGQLIGSYKRDFTFKLWGTEYEYAAADVGGGIYIDYERTYTVLNSFTRKDSSINITFNGHVDVKLLFVKFGYEFSDNWFHKFDSEYYYPTRSVIALDDEDPEYVQCTNLKLQDLSREELSDLPTLREPTRANDTIRYDDSTLDITELSRELLEEYCWEIDQNGQGKAIQIMVAAEFTLEDTYWEIVTNNFVVTSEDDLTDTSVSVTEINHSQIQITITDPQEGPWVFDVYGSKKWNGAIILDAELGNPVETSLTLDEVTVHKKDVTLYEYDDDGQVKLDDQGQPVIKDSYVGNVTQATLTYQAKTDDTESLLVLYMEEAGSQEHKGAIVAFLEPTAADETKTITFDIPNDVQSGEYAFYIKAMSAAWNGITYSQYTDTFNVIPQTARLYAEDFDVSLDAASPNLYNATFTLINDGSENVTDAHVELVFTNPDDGSIYVLAEDTVSLAAGTESKHSFNVQLPDDVDTTRGKLSLRLDAEDTVEEGIFDNDGDISQFISTARILPDGETRGDSAAVISWETIIGATSYTLNYAINQDWDNAVSITGLTGNSARLILAPGRYLYTIQGVDDNGNILGDNNINGKIDVDSCDELTFTRQDDSFQTETIFLYDGIYTLQDINLAGFSGTLSLYQFYPSNQLADDPSFTAQVVEGTVQDLQPFALENAHYRLLAQPADGCQAAPENLSLTLRGDLIVDTNSQREPVCITSSLDDKGEYFELLSSSIGLTAPDDIWDYSVSEGGQLSLSFNTTQVLNTDLVVNLFVQSSDAADEDDEDDGATYILAQSQVIAQGTSGEINILNQFAVINNFYIEVAAVDETQLLEHTDYSLSLFFDAFHAGENDDAIMDTEDDEYQVSGWVGYGDAVDSYLLAIAEDDGGVYSFTLKGDQDTAKIQVFATSEELLGEAVIGENGLAVIADMTLYAGYYYVDIVALGEDENIRSTDFQLSLTPHEFFSYMDNEQSYDIADEEDQFLLALNISEDGMYDLSQLQAGHNARIYEVLNTGELSELQPADGQQELLKGETYYLDMEYLHRAGTASLDQNSKTLLWQNDISLTTAEATETSQTIAWEKNYYNDQDSLVITLSDTQFTVSITDGTDKANVLGLTADATCSIIATVADTYYCSDDASLTATNTLDEAVILQGQDDAANVFFATVKGTWDDNYQARHDTMGFTVELDGKNKVIDIFNGSGSNNIVFLGNDENGDALFVDDIYSDSPDSLAQTQARLDNLTEIYAGDGDDIIDLTSKRFVYHGEQLTVHGGNGNDVIWANCGANALFGDAGNDMLVGANGNDLLVGGEGDDRLYGGGGDDVAYFAGNWGHDQLTQAENGSLTLCFADGSLDYWNQDTLLYDDGVNSLQVSGVTIDKIHIKVGAEATAFLAAI